MKLQSYIDGLMQERCKSIANALELHLSSTNPSMYDNVSTHLYVHWNDN